MTTMTSPRPTLIRNLRQWLNRSGPDQPSDEVLVQRYVQDRDEAAFAALVEQHGPMVLGVARRVVGDLHTAEDVFQATFLALARRASRLRRPEALPGWLHTTAYNIAVMALRARKRRDRTEARAPARASETPLEDLSSREMLGILDEELCRLPEGLRLPLVLCCLEGRSQDEAARLLGWTPGAVRGRLERGRQRLKDRLVRRGLSLPAQAGVPLLIAPPVLTRTLLQATLPMARDGASVSPVVSALAAGGSRTLAGTKWLALVVLAFVGLVGCAAGLALLSTPRPPTARATAAPPVGPVQDEAAGAAPLVEEPFARLGSSPLRIGNAAFALTPDGRTIVTVTPEGIVRTFDANTGRLLERRQLTDRKDVFPVGEGQAQLSADGRIVALDEISGNVHRVSVLEVGSGRRIFRHTLEQDEFIGYSAFPNRPYALAADGKQLAVAEPPAKPRAMPTLRVYDLATGRGRDLGACDFSVDAIRFTADGQRVLTLEFSKSRDTSTLACYDLPAGKQLWRLPTRGQPGDRGPTWREFAVSPDGRTVVIARTGKERGYRVVETDPRTGRPTESFRPYNRADPIQSLVIGPDNRTVVILGYDMLLQWDLQTGKEVKQFAMEEGWSGGPRLGAFSADGRTLVTNKRHLQRWDLTTGKPFFTVPRRDGLDGPVFGLAFTPDGREVFASSLGLAVRWDVTTGKWRHPESADGVLPQLHTTTAGIRALQSGGEGEAEQNIEYMVKVSDPLTNTLLHTVRWAEPNEVEMDGIRAYRLTADGKTLLVLHRDSPDEGEVNSYVTACDVRSGRRLARFRVRGYSDYARPPFSPCGRWVVLGEKVYHVGTGRELFTPTGEPGERLLPENERAHSPVWFSEDGRLLAGLLARKGEPASGRPDTLAVWELASGKVLNRVNGARCVAQVAFSPDGQSLALLDGREVVVRDLLTGKPRVRYRAPDVPCGVLGIGCGSQTLAFAPDGRTLATGHRDGSIQLWKVPQPAEAGPRTLAQVERENLWTDLGSDSPGKARAAMEQLFRHPDAATALLKARFRPAGPTPDDARITAHIKDLDSNVFATREEAERKLREWGARAEPALRRELAKTTSLERKLRIQRILDTITPPFQALPLSGEALRGVRAIEVLERVGTPEARVLLQAWTEQSRDMRMAAEARLALERRGSAKP